jgi:hypothetical protein
MDRLGNVLEPGRAEIDDLEFESRLDLPVGVLGQANPVRLANPFEPRRNVHPVAHQVAIALLDDVAEVNADPEDDAAILGHARVALDHGVLNFDRAADGVDDATELYDQAVASALDYAALVRGDRRIDKIAAQRPQPRQDAILVCAGEPAIADHIRANDRH